ncbi:hypothetical protein LUCX_93 [Xanthomonas phage vB_XciM_LucasX]|nr:hypothetical protein LUCX_93 [Xanthomonas phage vB_XciM_LucasX]
MPNHQKRSQNDQPVWDVLNGLSAAVGQCTQIPGRLIPYLSDKTLLSKISDLGRFNRLASTLRNDIRRLTDQFLSIQQQHAGRTGNVASQDDLMVSIQIHQNYVEWAATFDDVVIPTVMDMFEMIQQAGVTDLPAISSASQTVERHH